jgi:POT family proton-dependent oligopeptide transporter
VGELYGPADLRRAMAFQIFYIAIQVSVIAAPLVSGTLGEDVGWHYGFGCAGVVMVAGLALYVYAKPFLPADRRGSKGEKANPAKLSRGDVPRLGVLLALIPILGVSLLVNQEIFNAYLVWADEKFQLTFLGRTMPTSWMITIDATASFTLLIAVTAFWKWFADRYGKEPDELGKMIIGSLFSVAGALCLVIAAATSGGGKIGLFWPLMFHLLNSIGFGHTLPVALALFTKVAPKALTATVVGLYYLAFFVANKVVGIVGGWYSSMDTVQFWLLHVGAAAVGLIAFTVLKLTFGRVLNGQP